MPKKLKSVIDEVQAFWDDWEESQSYACWEQGEPNQYTILENSPERDKRWYVNLLFNGELTDEEQKEVCRVILNYINKKHEKV